MFLQKPCVSHKIFVEIHGFRSLAFKLLRVSQSLNFVEKTVSIFCKIKKVLSNF